MQKININKSANRYLLAGMAAIFLSMFMASCDFEFALPEAGSIPDATLPSADFSFTPGVDIETFMEVDFTNLSRSATDYSWDFGGGNTTADFEPSFTFSGEGTFPVTLTVMDKNGESSSITKDVVLIEPEEPDAPDPVLINNDFDKLPKSSGSDCSCSGWINKDIGEQGESSSGNGGSDNVVKFDNNEPDHVYQEFAVVENQSYTITLVTSFKSLVNNTPPQPSMLEIRILAGSGYKSGYSPVYYTETTDFPQADWGYSTVAQVEEEANNLLTEVLTNPEDDDYFTHQWVFNSGDNTSLALFIRGIGGDASGDYGYNSGDEEIRADIVTITANN